MANALRQVLQIFEENDGPLSMTQMARQLDITPGMLEILIGHWVRKGKLREVIEYSADCAMCGDVAASCVFAGDGPRRYELVKNTNAIKVDVPVGGCSHCG